MSNLVSILDEFLESREEDLRVILANLIRNALDGDKPSIELVIRYLIKPLLQHSSHCYSGYYELAGMGNRAKAKC